jgi:hypothetical protein
VHWNEVRIAGQPRQRHQLFNFRQLDLLDFDMHHVGGIFTTEHLLQQFGHGLVAIRLPIFKRANLARLLHLRRQSFLHTMYAQGTSSMILISLLGMKSGSLTRSSIAIAAYWALKR